jgi:hypothetical protein
MKNTIANDKNFYPILFPHIFYEINGQILLMYIDYNK